ncbi:uncharacterized protein LOC118567234 [Fundulus heteroclitus]|uniref:uncharacterized protein LOC118567234 n=1 Tax=Fundulus heteroclitus TaxID=8078 RepID=UPI00165CA2D4|nr:uncharacterized protein LOC118567234 [Fundulus heteroclitus]
MSIPAFSSLSACFLTPVFLLSLPVNELGLDPDSPCWTSLLYRRRIIALCVLDLDSPGLRLWKSPCRIPACSPATLHSRISSLGFLPALRTQLPQLQGLTTLSASYCAWRGRVHFLLVNKNIENATDLCRLKSESCSRTLQDNLARKMDSLPDTEWRTGVEKSISQLEAGVAEILGHLRSQEAPALPQTSASVTTSRVMTSTLPEPRLTPPEPFGGNPDQCRAFLTQCEIHFELQPSSYPTDRSKVAFVISLLTGKAKLWGDSQGVGRSYHTSRPQTNGTAKGSSSGAFIPPLDSFIRLCCTVDPACFSGS